MSDLLLLLIAAVATFGVVWSFRAEWSPLGLPSGKVARPWILLGAVGVTLALGIVGWLIQPIRESVTAESSNVGVIERVIAATYLAAQQLLLNAPAEAGQNATIQASRIAAIAAIILLAREATERLLAHSLLRWRLARQSQHVIICGLGRTGFQLLRHLRDPALLELRGRKRRKVIVVEHDADHARIDAARELGAVVVHGDASDALLMAKLGAARASEICFVTGSDEVNVEGSCAAAKLCAGAKPTAGTGECRIIAHLRSADLATPLEAFVAGQGRNGRPVKVIAFNVLQQAAMEVVTKHLPPIRPRTAEKVLHAIVFGCGPVGQAIALHVAEYAHYENFRRTRLTIIHATHDEAALRSFKADHPRLFPIASGRSAWDPDPALDDWSYGVRIADPEKPTNSDAGVTFAANGGFEAFDGSPTSPGCIDRLVALAQRGDTVPCIFICGENDERNCTAAFELRDELDSRLGRRPGKTPVGEQVHVFAYVPHRPSYAKIAQRDGLVTFGSAEENCTFDSISWTWQRQLAELIAEVFHNKFRADESVPCPPFWERELWDRRSNLSAAGHVHAKLATLDLALVRAGTALSPRGDKDPFSEPHRLRIAKMEHNRWMAERLLHGWTFGEKDLARRHRPTLADWDNLSEEEKAKDLAQAIELPNQCARAQGFALEKSGSEESLRGAAGPRGGR